MTVTTATVPNFKTTKQKAEQGDATAQYILGIMYDLGQGAEQDTKKAIEWYTKASDQGHTGAIANLGVMYSSGDGVPTDYIKAYEYWEISDGQGVFAHWKTAVKLYIQASTQGNAKAALYLGFMFGMGNGVERDLKKGFYWVKKAAEQEHITAQYIWGWHR